MSAPTVEKPRSAEELAAVLHNAAVEKLAVTPLGGGRARGMGNPLERCDVELHTTRLDRVVEHSQADMVVTVEAGIRLEELQQELGKAGQFLPLDPFNSPGHTIGGLLATGWTGPQRFRYGSARDFLIGIRVALPDGKLASAGGRVVKNVSGYDLMKVHYGALGTLGVIVAASFKLFPKPLHDVTVVGPDGESCWDAAGRALALPMAPVAVEVLQDGRVLARFCGSKEAVEDIVRGLGWKRAGDDEWARHSKLATGPRWARIAVPAGELPAMAKLLPQGAQDWWASPPIGILNWSADVDAPELRSIRSEVERRGGTLTMLAAPDDFMREVGAWGTQPATIDVMRRIKHAFDPENVLNPGRYVY